MMGRRDALYRIMATTEWEPGPENTSRAGGWASHDSLTITKVGGIGEGQAQEPGTMLQTGVDWSLLFRNRGLGEGDY